MYVCVSVRVCVRVCAVGETGKADVSDLALMQLSDDDLASLADTSTDTTTDPWAQTASGSSPRKGRRGAGKDGGAADRTAAWVESQGSAGVEGRDRAGAEGAANEGDSAGEGVEEEDLLLMELSDEELEMLADKAESTWA